MIRQRQIERILHSLRRTFQGGGLVLLESDVLAMEQLYRDAQCLRRALVMIADAVADGALHDAVFYQKLVADTAYLADEEVER